GLEMVTQEVLGEVLVFGEVPNPDAPESGRRLAIHGTARRVDVVDDLRDLSLRAGDQDLVLLGRLVGADRVVNRDALAGVEATVVARIVPGQDLRVHGLGVETFDEVHRLSRLFGIDRDGPTVLSDIGAAVGPEDREQRDVGVTAVAERGAEGMADRLALLADPEPVLPGVRVLLAD